MQTATLGGADSHDPRADDPPLRRDIDVLVLDEMRPGPSNDRFAAIARVARLADRYHVLIRGGVFDDDRRTLLRRARVVVQCCHSSESTRLAVDVLAAGALLLIQAGNREFLPALTPELEYVEYIDADLETKLDHYLSHEVDRATIAVAGRARADELSFAVRWANAIGIVHANWADLTDRASHRIATPVSLDWTARTWQWLTTADRSGDPTLPGDLAAARAAGALRPDGIYALGLIADSPTEAAELFAVTAVGRPGDVLAGLGRAEALRAIGRTDDSKAAARIALARLDHADGGTPEVLDLPPHPPGAARLRTEWEKIGWTHAGNPTAESAAKKQLIRWRLNAFLAELTGGITFFHEAALARPDLPEARAALGCALARANRTAEAVHHLRAAIEAQPFDCAAARALGHVLQALSDGAERDRLAADRRLLAKAAPQAIPTEDWFAGVAEGDVHPIVDHRPGIVWEWAIDVPSHIPIPAPQPPRCLMAKKEAEAPMK